MAKRLVCFLLIISFILTGIPAGNILKTKADTLSYLYNESNNDYFESIKHQLPANTLKKAGGRPFNYKLWRDKGIVVYGDYIYVPSNIQSFRNATIENGNVVQNKGYYIKGSLKGEYRYHGYTASGSLYSNNDFPDDATSSRTLEQKYWIKFPWSSSYVTKNKPNKSDFNWAADNGNTKVLEMFKLNFTPQYYFHNGQFYSGSVPIKDIMNIQTAPSKRNAGEGVIYHRTKGTKEDKTWYDTQRIEPFKAVPSIALCESVPPSAPIKVPEKTNNAVEDNKVKNEKITFDIEVTGIYPDGFHINDPVSRTVEFTRYDIKQWILTLQIAGQTIIKSGNDVQMLENRAKGRHKFRVILTVQDIWNGNYLVNEKIPYTAKAKCEFETTYSDVKFSYEGSTAGNVLLKKQASTDIDFKVIAASNPAHNSVIEVDGTKNEVVVVNVTGEVLKYTNASNIKEYEFFIGVDDVQNKNADKVVSSVLTCTKSKTFNIYKDNFEPGKVYTFEIPIIVNVELKTPVQGKTKLTGQTNLVVHFSRNAPPFEPEDITHLFPPYRILDMVDPNPGLTPVWFDIAPYPCSDSTDMSKAKSAYVVVGGQTVDYNTFFSRNYVFNRTGWIDVQVNYMSNDDFPAFFATQVYMYDTTPRANIITSSTMKENRKIVFNADILSANPSAVLERYPITYYSWTVEAITGEPEYAEIQGSTNNSSLVTLFRGEGTYKVNLTVTNTAGKSSTSSYTFYVHPDYQPTAIILFNESCLLRGQRLTTYEFSASSYDGDTVALTRLELWYDSDNNGTIDTKLNEWINPTEFPAIIPDKLGNYQLRYYVYEEFGEETIPEFIPPGAHRRWIRKDYDFWCDNAMPMTDVYIDKPVVRPIVDVMFLLDKNLDDSKRNYIKNKRVEIENMMRWGNLDSRVVTWDMKTYIDTLFYSTSKDTGSSYPEPGIDVNLANGYSGTLSRVKVTTYQGTGTYWEEEDVTYSRTFNAIVQNKRHGLRVFEGANPPHPIYVSYAYSYWESKEWGDTYNINEDGYVGTIPAKQVDYSPTDSEIRAEAATKQAAGTLPGSPSYYTVTQTATKYFSGTLSKTVKEKVQKTYTYTGHAGEYSGTVSKAVRQSYNQAVNFRPTSEKYLVYVSDNIVNELSDLNFARANSDAKLVLIGNDSIKTQVSGWDKHIGNYGYQTIDELLAQVFGYLNDRYKNIAQHTVLVGETFNILTDDSDHENDTIINAQFRYEHDPYYFDNDMGVESGCLDSNSNPSEGVGWVGYKKTVFNKPGMYIVKRKILDSPATDSRFSNFNYWSGVREMIMYVHRKPIADALLDWDFDGASLRYLTTWVDKSYDLDHQYSRADKGIADRKIMYRQTKDRYGNNISNPQWVYAIPDNLEPATYEVYYYVKDVEGVWSDPWVRTIVLPDVVPVQLLDAQIRTRAEFVIGDSKYGGIDSAVQGPDTRSKRIPASENITLYNIKTRSPYSVSLEARIYNSSGAQVGSTVTRNFSQGVTGSKTANDITWYNFNVQIPASFADGDYRIRISCVDSYNQVQFRDFWIKVFTPIELTPQMTATVSAGEQVAVGATTSVYATNTTVQLFRGTAYQTGHMAMTSSTQTNGRQWSINYTIPSNIPDGTYIAYYTSTLPSGKSETKTVNFTLESLKITHVSIEGYWNHWRGQRDIFGKVLSNEPHRFLSYEKVKIRVNTTGYADKVVIRFSPELESMVFTNHLGHTYRYKDFAEYEVFFPRDSTFLLDSSKKDATVYWEYILPLAPSSKSWEDTLLKQPYRMIVTVYKGTKHDNIIIDDIHITGNIYDLVYIQPE